MAAKERFAPCTRSGWIRQRAAIAQRPILRLKLPTGCARAGPVAQRLEPAAHNGLVGGSIPSRPTNVFNFLRTISAVTEFQPHSRPSRGAFSWALAAGPMRYSKKRPTARGDRAARQ